MGRALLSLAVLLLTAIGAIAQDRPQVTAEFEETETVIGQPLVLRIKVLVPTWLPKPPEFPSLDLPGLLVRLPERASGPVSERVGSDTWSGVQRAYRLYPLQPGRFEIPAQTLRITYAKPGGSDPVTDDIALEPIAFTATVPGAARGLNPLIVATGFSMEAKVEGQDQLAVGGAVVRTLTAKISGTTPILIPQLTPESGGEGLRAYPDEPTVTDTEDRGVLSGTRSERTTYLATAEGTAELPAVHFDWFNLDTGKVETAEVPSVSLSIALGEAVQTERQPIDWVKVLAAAAVAAVVVLILRALWPRLMGLIRDVRNRWRTSELYASRQVTNAIRSRDLGKTYSALETWRRFVPGVATDELRAVLARIGQSRHGQITGKAGASDWGALGKLFASVRRKALRAQRRRATGDRLCPLNPDWRPRNES